MKHDNAGEMVDEGEREREQREWEDLGRRGAMLVGHAADVKGRSVEEWGPGSKRNGERSSCEVEMEILLGVDARGDGAVELDRIDGRIC